MSSLITWLLIIGFAGFALGCLRRIQLWNQGRSVALSPWLILTIPKRYLVDLHHIVVRDRYIANTHIAAAGGVVGSLVVLSLIYIAGFQAGWLYGLVWGLLGLGLIGAAFVAWRRVNRPERLSAGAWNAIPYSLFAYGIGFTGLTLVEAGLIKGVFAAVALVFAAIGIIEITGGALLSRPLKHLLSGSAHLAFHPRQDRFESTGQLSTDLKPMDSEAPQYGVGHVQDFAWNRLLSFDACIECGKCQEVCPARAAGQPLNPKKLIQDLVAGLEGRSDAKYRGAGHPGQAVGAHAPCSQNGGLIGSMIEEETLFACTTCRACVEVCPMMIEHVDAIVDMRRFVALEQGGVPEKSRSALDDLRNTDTVSANALEDRANWSVDLELPVATPDRSCDVLLWSGEAGFELRNQKTLRLVARLLKKAGLDVAVLGEHELDTGDLARRLGDELLFQSLAERNIRYLNSLSFKRIVTIDPHVFHVLSQEYPAFGGQYRVEHHTQLLADLIDEGVLPIDKPLNLGTVTYHDPCYLGRYNGEVAAPRALIEAVGAQYTEMERSGKNSRCCGWGGGSAFSDIPGERRIPDMRMNDIHDVDAQTVAVACPNCMTMLDGVVQDRTRVVDVVELVADAVGV